ncbi:gamma-butyrobetaine dioxygenase [Hyalella azteca]|uniref:Gamma-butyrobetaine dioxygenase n=1 Tax=Hyalella azteca TaxID=294128 RepID=A0A8B7PD19_HYAAZ|nr:gamma-butyrobetaine dioxygenase [Hyalella azteca]
MHRIAVHLRSALTQAQHLPIVPLHHPRLASHVLPVVRLSSVTSEPHPLTRLSAAASEHVTCCSLISHHVTTPVRRCSDLRAKFSHEVKLARVSSLPEQKMLEVEWAEGGRSIYPWLWLRDNCQCDQCFHPVSLSRTSFLQDLDLNVAPKSFELTEDGFTLSIHWTDGHSSRHEAPWLHVRAFQAEQRRARDLVHKIPRKFWPPQLPEANWEEVMQSDASLLQWLLLLETYGLVVMKSAPQQQGRIRELAERVAFVKRTHYGEDFSVIVKPDPSNVAYSNKTLALHLDLPYYFYKPGVQFIHFVRQHEGVGGESQVSDALEVAHTLREEHPQHFRLLSSVPVDWVDHANEDGRQYFKALKMPVICLESDGETIWRINFSQPQRDSYFSACPVEDVHAWYAALKAFHDLLYDPRFCRTFKMPPGTVLTLDNLRVTHGRMGFPDSDDVHRHVDGCYVDWDEVRSRRRVLADTLGADITQGL